jgi:hypothetical protein
MTVGGTRQANQYSTSKSYFFKYSDTSANEDNSFRNHIC